MENFILKSEFFLKYLLKYSKARLHIGTTRIHVQTRVLMYAENIDETISFDE